jgi:hypothetical protein
MYSRFKSADDVLAIEVEIQSEKASGLRRVAAKLESLLAELEQLQGELVGLSGPARARCAARHEELRAEAEKQRWYLVIQREALGLRQHGDVYALYRIPPTLKLE